MRAVLAADAFSKCTTADCFPPSDFRSIEVIVPQKLQRDCIRGAQGRDRTTDVKKSRRCSLGVLGAMPVTCVDLAAVRSRERGQYVDAVSHGEGWKRVCVWGKTSWRSLAKYSISDDIGATVVQQRKSREKYAFIFKHYGSRPCRFLIPTYR
jgi:hypothetical protein